MEYFLRYAPILLHMSCLPPEVTEAMDKLDIQPFAGGTLELEKQGDFFVAFTEKVYALYHQDQATHIKFKGNLRRHFISPDFFLFGSSGLPPRLHQPALEILERHAAADAATPEDPEAPFTRLGPLHDSVLARASQDASDSLDFGQLSSSSSRPLFGVHEYALRRNPSLAVCVKNRWTQSGLRTQPYNRGPDNFVPFPSSS